MERVMFRKTRTVARTTALFGVARRSSSAFMMSYTSSLSTGRYRDMKSSTWHCAHSEKSCIQTYSVRPDGTHPIVFVNGLMVSPVLESNSMQKMV